MKRIALISSEEVPLSIESSTEKYQLFYPAGYRIWQISRILSKVKDFDITLFVPDTAIPKEVAKQSSLPFKLSVYAQKAAHWNWSAELDRKLKSMDFVIIQTVQGTGFLNCSVLPGTVNVIADGFSPILTEIPGFLLGHSKPYRKIYWERFTDHYFKLLKRANCVLYANDRQYYYYEGQLFAKDKLGWNAFQFSPLLKVSSGIEGSPIESTTSQRTKLKLLWNGPIYPWHHPEKLLEIISTHKDISIDFCNISSPNNKHAFKTFFQDFFDRWKDFSNIFIHEESSFLSLSELSEYDANIVLSRDWIEENYSSRIGVLNSLLSGIPVLLNNKNSWFGELGFPKDSIYPIHSTALEKDLIYYKNNKNSLFVSKDVQSKIQTDFSWEQTVLPLVAYIERFSL